MIIFLTTPRNRKTLRKVAKTIGHRTLRVKDYDWLFAQSRLPRATYVFTDMERLAPHELHAAAQYFQLLKKAGMRVLNDPARVKVRFALLDTLHREGINRFHCYHAERPVAPQTFPVFIRAEADHSKPISDLIHTQIELEETLAAMVERGIPLRHLLVIEYCAKPVREGLYVKHSVFRVADRFIGCTSVGEDNWCVKYGTFGLSTDEELDRSAGEATASPYLDQMRPIFELACIDFGRSDFGINDEGVAVFEINTNPDVKSLKSHRHAVYLKAVQQSFEIICDAIEDIDSPSGNSIAVDVPLKRRWRLKWPLRRRVEA